MIIKTTFLKKKYPFSKIKIIITNLILMEFASLFLH